MIIKDILTSPDTITVYWKRVIDEQGRQLHIEVKYKHEGVEDWIIKIIVPPHYWFEARNLLPSILVDFELRAISYDGIFGPVTKKSIRTQCE